MKTAITVLLIGLTFISHITSSKAQCRFNIMRTKVKVWRIYLDTQRNKQVEKKIASLSGKMILSNAANKRVFETKKGSFKLGGYQLETDYDFYVDKVRMAVNIPTDSLRAIISAALGPKKISKYPQITNILPKIKTEKVTSYFYQFHGTRYSETDDRSYHYINYLNENNKYDRVMVEFNFNRRPKCR